jgi:hypothetical protein
MKLEGSLSCSQEPTIGLPISKKTNPDNVFPPCFFDIHFNNIIYNRLSFDLSLSTFCGFDIVHLGRVSFSF